MKSMKLPHYPAYFIDNETSQIFIVMKLKKAKNFFGGYCFSGIEFYEKTGKWEKTQCNVFTFGNYYTYLGIVTDMYKQIQ